MNKFTLYVSDTKFEETTDAITRKLVTTIWVAATRPVYCFSYWHDDKDLLAIECLTDCPKFGIEALWLYLRGHVWQPIELEVHDA